MCEALGYICFHIATHTNTHASLSSLSTSLENFQVHEGDHRTTGSQASWTDCEKPGNVVFLALEKVGYFSDT